MPDEKWGEVGKAAVVLKEGERLKTAQVLQFLQGKIGNFKIPKYIEFVDQLPRTASGKLKKYLLIEKFRKAGR